MQNLRSRLTHQEPSTLPALGLVALFLVAAVLIGLLFPHTDSLSAYRNILVVAALLAGFFGLYVYLARQFNGPLPHMLRVPANQQDTSWRLLVLSLIVLAFPLLMLAIQHFLLHQ